MLALGRGAKQRQPLQAKRWIWLEKKRKATIQQAYTFYTSYKRELLTGLLSVSRVLRIETSVGDFPRACWAVLASANSTLHYGQIFRRKTDDRRIVHIDQASDIAL